MIQDLLNPHHLQVLGGFAVNDGEAGFPTGTRTLLLIGPQEPGFGRICNCSRNGSGRTRWTAGRGG